MIDGVAIKELVRHPDERGYFEEIIRSSDDFFKEGFAQLSHSHMLAGVVKAWHIHKTQIDWWFIAGGVVKAALYDTRKESKTFRELNEFTLGGHEEPNRVIKIPAGVAHGLKVIEGPADLIYVTSGIYSRDEEGRIEYNDPNIGYDWEQGIPIINIDIT